MLKKHLGFKLYILRKYGVKANLLISVAEVIKYTPNDGSTRARRVRKKFTSILSPLSPCKHS